jgi:hypothetical protein
MAPMHCAHLFICSSTRKWGAARHPPPAPPIADSIFLPAKLMKRKPHENSQFGKKCGTSLLLSHIVQYFNCRWHCEPVLHVSYVRLKQSVFPSHPPSPIPPLIPPSPNPPSLIPTSPNPPSRLLGQFGYYCL